jgi:MFS family permease
MGLMYLLSPLTLGLLRLYAQWARYIPIVGLLIMCLALVASSFCTTVGGMIATQGIMYAIGGSIAYCPCMLYIDEWFVARKGLAYGIMWAGNGLAGVVLPLLLQSLLGSLGHQTTLRLWSGVLFVITVPLAWFIKPRVPVHGTSKARPWDLRFWGLKAFLCYQFCNVVEAMGFFLPCKCNAFLYGFPSRASVIRFPDPETLADNLSKQFTCRLSLGRRSTQAPWPPPLASFW